MNFKCATATTARGLATSRFTEREVLQLNNKHAKYS